MKYVLGLNSEKVNNEFVLKNFEGVGMIRGENLCINRMQYFTIKDFREYLCDYLKYTAQFFDNKMVWYRTADLVPHQINILDGCDEKLDTKDFLFGLRGIRRNLKYLDTFNKEIETFIKAYNSFNNLGIMFPFVSNVDEMRQVLDILRIDYNYNGKVGMMMEIPSTILLLDKYEELGIDNYTIGANDLTSMVLGSNRDTEYYSINDEAVSKIINIATEKVHSYGKKITVAGYINEELKNECEQMKVDYFNVHYNDIPKIFNVDDAGIYTKQYRNIKNNYNKVKSRHLNDK